MWKSLALSLTYALGIYYFRSHLNVNVIDRQKHVKTLAKTIQRVALIRIYHYVSAFACIMVCNFVAYFIYKRYSSTLKIQIEPPIGTESQNILDEPFK